MQDLERKLYEYGENRRRIEKIEREVQRQIEKKDAFAERMLSGPRYTDVRVDGGTMADPVLDTVQIIVDAYWPHIQSLFTQIADLKALMIEVDLLMDRAELTEPERQYIELRYFTRKSHSGTASDMGYCEEQARRHKNSAFEKMISNER